MLTGLSHQWLSPEHWASQHRNRYFLHEKYATPVYADAGNGLSFLTKQNCVNARQSASHARTVFGG
jgi:hypothetical protein